MSPASSPSSCSGGGPRWPRRPSPRLLEREPALRCARCDDVGRGFAARTGAAPADVTRGRRCPPARSACGRSIDGGAPIPGIDDSDPVEILAAALGTERDRVEAMLEAGAPAGPRGRAGRTRRPATGRAGRARRCRVRRLARRRHRNSWHPGWRQRRERSGVMMATAHDRHDDPTNGIFLHNPLILRRPTRRRWSNSGEQAAATLQPASCCPMSFGRGWPVLVYSRACRSSTSFPTRSCCRPSRSASSMSTESGPTPSCRAPCRSAPSPRRIEISCSSCTPRSATRSTPRSAGSAWSAARDLEFAPAGPISGFLLRSRLVSGWPALHVRAYSADELARRRPDREGVRRRAHAPAATGAARTSRAAVPVRRHPERSSTSRSPVPACSTASISTAMRSPIVRLRDVLTAKRLADTVAPTFGCARTGIPRGHLHRRLGPARWVSSPATNMHAVPGLGASERRVRDGDAAVPVPPGVRRRSSENTLRPDAGRVDAFRPTIGLAEIRSWEEESNEH